jgi:dihydropteroate synthase
MPDQLKLRLQVSFLLFEDKALATSEFPSGWQGQLRCRDRRLTIGHRTLIMGIINVTPDSFSGDGVDRRIDEAVALGRQMVDDGADLLDIGGESTRPGAGPVEVAEEIDRVVPVLAALVQLVQVPLSVDTRQPRVAESALQAGAHLVNDVAGLQRDPGMAEVVSAFDAGVVAMHSPGESWEISWPVAYADVVADVKRYLERSVAIAVHAQIGLDQIVVDPGFGFGKSVADNLLILRRLAELRTLNQPLLLGTSRKSTIGRILGLPVEERLEGSLATIPLAIAQGADIVRVHDVRPSVRVARMADAVVRGVVPSQE